MACGNSARENPNGERPAETPQGRIQTENGLRKLRKGESKRRMACGNPARENPNGEWLAETPQKENQSGERLAEVPQGTR